MKIIRAMVEGWPLRSNPVDDAVAATLTKGLKERGLTYFEEPVSTKVLIEVTPRMAEEAYHARINNDIGLWGCGDSVEGAAVDVIITAHHQLGLSTEALDSTESSNNRHRLRELKALLKERGVDLEIQFLPDETR